jgi:hypothetical protein
MKPQKHKGKAKKDKDSSLKIQEKNLRMKPALPTP